MPPGRISAQQIIAWLSPQDRAIIGLSACAAAIICGWVQGGLAALGFGLLTATVLAISVIDARHFLIPDRLSLPLLPLGLAWQALANPAAGLETVMSHLAVIAVMALGLMLLRWGFRHYRGDQALGLGDVKLMLAAAAWIAPSQMAAYVFCAAATALIQALLRNKPRTERLPFGIHLALWLLAFVTIEAPLIKLF